MVTKGLWVLLEAKPDRVEAVRFYAEAGHWYDAVASLSELIEATPGDTTLRSQRVALLRQVGLNEIAEYDISLSKPTER